MAWPRPCRGAATDIPPAAGFGRAKSVVLVFANGGQSQIDMWDPKPAAPLDVRGAFSSIPTAVPGIHFGEHLPSLAKLADRFTVVRSMSHEDLDHGSAVYLALTGRYHPLRSSNPPPGPNDAPTYGSILRRVKRDEQFVSDAVHVNAPALVPTTVSPGQDGGLLGRAFEPLVVGNVIAAEGVLPGLGLHADLALGRMNERLHLKQVLDRTLQNLEASQRTRDVNGSYSLAMNLLASPRGRAAFDLEQEPAMVRERYGNDRSGQALLLARRLVEAGVPYINVIWNHSNRGQDTAPRETDEYGWDTHNDIFNALRQRLLPRFDQSFSAFLEDLEQRGLLDETLVVCMGEFGRAPRVALERNFAGSSPGRKHWAAVYSLVMAGAGVVRGAALGASDRVGGEPITERYGPWDVAATMFHALGLDPRQHYYDSLGRPFSLAIGRPMEGLYGG